MTDYTDTLHLSPPPYNISLFTCTVAENDEDAPENIGFFSIHTNSFACLKYFEIND